MCLLLGSRKHLLGLSNSTNMANNVAKDSTTSAASSNVFRTEIAALQADLRAYCKKYAEVQHECEKLRMVRVSHNEDTDKELKLAKEIGRASCRERV